MIKTYNFLNFDEARRISNYILNTETLVKSLGDDVYNGTSRDSLTGRYNIFNYLNYFPGEIMIPKLKFIFTSGVIQCWANTFRKGEGILPHSHGVGFLSANVFLSGNTDIGTFYGDKKIESQIGKLVVFPSELVHYVANNPSENIRVSMAFDIYPMSCLSRNEFHNKDRFYILN